MVPVQFAWIYMNVYTLSNEYEIVNLIKIWHNVPCTRSKKDRSEIDLKLGCNHICPMCYMDYGSMLHIPWSIDIFQKVVNLNTAGIVHDMSTWMHGK